MKPLDALYGAGTSAAFRADVGTAKITETALDTGSVRVDVRWRAGELKIECSADEVMFLTLRSDREGRYSGLCEALPRLFAVRGVERFVCSPADRASEVILRKRGKWRRSGRRLVWRIG